MIYGYATYHCSSAGRWRSGFSPDEGYTFKVIYELLAIPLTCSVVNTSNAPKVSMSSIATPTSIPLRQEEV
jgi:hypothetical protein